MDQLSRTPTLQQAKHREERPETRRCCGSWTPWRAACERSSVNIDLGSARRLLPTGRLQLRANQGTLCLRHVLCCRLVSSRKQSRSPAGSPRHRRSATLHNPGVIDRLESERSAGTLFKQQLWGGFFQSQQKKTSRKIRSWFLKKQHWRRDFTDQPLNLRSAEKRWKE